MITGASSGIGKACAIQFAQKKSNLLLISRSKEKLQELKEELISNYSIKVDLIQLDVRDCNEVQSSLEDYFKSNTVDILINNAGLSLALDKIQEADTKDWDQMIDTNIKGFLYITRYVLPNMIKNNFGHIINIGSISSHEVYSGGVVYCATKFAVKAISRGIKMDVHGTAIKVTEIDPGLVNTNFSITRFKGNKKTADNVYEGMVPLIADDIADAIVYATTRPDHVSLPTIKVYPTDQTAAHMVYRR